MSDPEYVIYACLAVGQACLQPN